MVTGQNHLNRRIINQKGRVLKVFHENILVEFDNYINGHDGGPGGPKGKYGHCWWVLPGSLELIEEKTKGEIKMGESKEKYICDKCGKEFDFNCGDYDGQVFEYNGEWHHLCDDCFEEDFAYCKNCNDIIARDDAHFIDEDDGDVYCCESCTEEDYYRCYDCGNWIQRGSEEYYHIASRYGNGNEVICEDCRQNYWGCCEDCGDYFRDEDLNYHEYDDRYYCDQCYDEHGRGDYNGICEYHSGPELEYYREPHKKSYNFKDFKGYGFELEVDRGGYDHDNAKIVNEMLDCEAYCAGDGSLDDGFEIISHPHTREAMEAMPMNDVLAWLIRNGYKSHDAGTCGLHVHASKLLFGDEEKDRINNIAKIVMFYEIFWDDVLKVSRRSQSQVDDWANRYNRGKKELYEMTDTAVKTGSTRGRYFAVNLCNKHTIEFRLMRGTLKKETFWATLDFIMTTVENASKIPFAQINRPELWLKGMKQTTLDYIRSRGAFTSVVGLNNIETNSEEGEEE